jgi:hypothetical protein
MSIAYGHFDASVGGAADHHDCISSAVVHYGLEFVADEHRWSSLVDNEVIGGRCKRVHYLPAEAVFYASWLEFAGMVDFLIVHAPPDPSCRFVFPQERRLARVDGRDLGRSGGRDEWRCIPD